MAKRLRMLSIGTATQDVFLVGGDNFKPEAGKDGARYTKLPLGAKLGLEKVVFTTGGNATNAATTFARQGLRSAFMGVVGTEPSGQMVMQDLAKEGVDTKNAHQDDQYRTGYSTILLAPTGERTQLRYHGDTLHADGSDINLKAIRKADWLYVSSVGSIGLLERVLDLAARYGTKVAFNPATRELEHISTVRTLLDNVTVLIANKEEMSQIVEGKTAEELARNAASIAPVALVSDGPNGAVACDRQSGTMVIAGMYKDVKVIDRLGAGDAFGSGFTCKWAQGASLKDAVTFASANSTSVVSFIGAKTGILKSDVKIHDMKMEEKRL